MKKKLSIKRLISLIVIGESIVLLLWLVNLHNTEETVKLLIFFPIMTIALAIVVQIHNYYIDKIEEEKNLKVNIKRDQTNRNKNNKDFRGEYRNVGRVDERRNKSR